MATVTKAANTDTVEFAATWTNVSNAFATTGDDVYATASPPKNGSATAGFGFPNFTTSDIPDGSTINSVTVTVEWAMTASVTGGQLVLTPRLAGAVAGTATTKTTTTEEQSTASYNTTLPSLAQLRDTAASVLCAAVQVSKGSTNTAMTGRVDFISITVDYTASVYVPRHPAHDFGAITPN